MTNAKTTKRALLTSVMSMLLCASMLIGSTFAWFTDTASTGVNKIMAGNLNVDLYMKSGDSYVNISDDEKPIFGSYDSTVAQNDNLDTLWEPGKTQVAYLKIVNNGNLALKYQVALNTINPTDSKDLYKVMQYQIVPDAQSDATWTPGAGKTVTPGTAIVTTEDGAMQPKDEHYFALLIHMDESAGNEYMDGKVEFDITVLATQLNSEADSFGPNYDENATYDLSVNEDGLYETNSMAGLSKVAALASSDSSITEVVYVDTEGNETTVPVVAGTNALNEAIKSNNDVVVVKSGTYNVPSVSAGKEIDIVGTKETILSLTSAHTQAGGSTLNFTGITINGNGYTNGMGNGTKVNYTDCTFNTADMYLYGAASFTNCTFNDCGTYALWTWGASKVEFTGCTFNTTGKALYVNANYLDDGSNHQTVVITNCKFYDTGDNDTQKAAIETGDDYNKSTYDIFITNSTFKGFAVTEDKSSSIQWNYGGTNLGTNVWGNKYLMGTNKLNVVIDGVDVH